LASQQALRGRASFDSFPSDFVADPYRHYSHLRAEDPVHLSSRGVWTLTRYDDVASVLRDPRFGRKGLQDLLNSSRHHAQGNGTVPMLFQDAPGHARLRTLIGRAFTLSLIENLRPRIHEIVDELLDRVVDTHAIDLISGLAFPLPVYAIAELFGVTPAHRDLFHKWSIDLASGIESQSPAAALDRTLATQQAIAGHFRSALAERRQHPRNDLLTGLIAAQENGDRLTEFELLDICGLLFVAGHATTVNMLGNGILALLLHPTELRRLQRETRLLPNALEELLRYESPVQRVTRVANADVKIGGRTIPRGAVVCAVLGAANRDPARFFEPDRLDLSRRECRHLAFGLGDRFCLGAALARLEGQIAIGTLLRRLPTLELTARPPAWRHSIETRGLRELHAVF
jgi:cytochrome P450